MLLADRTVLLVDPDTSALDSLTLELRSRGAKCFPARDAATAVWGARETLPDVVVCSLELPDGDANALLRELETTAEALPAIALTNDRVELARLRDEQRGGARRFDKYLAKPVSPTDLVDALCCVLGPSAGHAAPSVEAIGDAFERHDYRRLLAGLNATTSHRYTALFRFDGDALTSVWTFDRKEPKADAFPLDVRIGSTPLAPVRHAGGVVCISDTAEDDRVGHGERHADMRGFVAVPLHEADDTVFGALCHFDPDPLVTDASALDLLERTAKIFRFTKRRPRPR